MEGPVLSGHMSIILRRINVNKIKICRNFKMKRTKNIKPKVSNSDRALEHFDLHYRPVYESKWPSIRISLLTAKKSCAVMNNFAESHKYMEKLNAMGAYNIMQAALTEQQKRTAEHLDDVCQITQEVKNFQEFKSASDHSQVGLPLTDADEETFEEKESKSADDFIKLNDTIYIDEDDRKDLDRTNLSRFIPTETVYSESHKLRIEEARRSVFTPMDVKVDVVKPRKIVLPSDLQVMAFPGGDVSSFPNIKADKPNGYLCSFIMDAASVLPVIALDLEKGDNVLDLCAAPGGKSLSILQTGLAGSLTCNDLSGSRMARLSNILYIYIPEEKRQHVTMTRQSGLFYDRPGFDKVLVDVPCNTDRHVLSQDDNNLFNPHRIQERIQMPVLQKDLLLSGIKSCRPGGCIVYSTCTLSPAQNDGVIQDTLDDLWRNTDIDVVVEDLEEMTFIFKDTFKFYKKSRFGQLVIPALSLNYGPMYFCRLRRIS